jgi:hypothetical protein
MCRAWLLLIGMLMMGKSYTRTALLACAFAFFPLADRLAFAADDAPITRKEFLLLQQQNQQLMQQVQQQQQMIQSLGNKVSVLEAGKSLPTPPSTEPTASASTKPEEPALPAESSSSIHLGKLDISGEGGVAFFKSPPSGQFPHSTFRIDEARLFLEAPVWGDVYFYSELDLAQRETTSLALNVGELYLDFEDVSKLWGCEGMLNIRAGRFYIPFGEEYANRFAIDNPLISHSVSDIWGADDGVELYGKLGPVHYAVAVQNGGDVTSESLQGDKSVSGRIGADPANWLHMSVSAMRTGELNVKNGVSALWFGNGWFHSIGSPATTSFHANLIEADLQFRLPFAQIKAAGGYANYNDDDLAANNNRDIYYYYVEGTHDWTHNFYSAVRWSQALAHKGYPIVGSGNMTTYGFDELTKDYWRLSLGLGYRFNRNLLVKAEYSFNQGSEINGSFRDGENQFSIEAAFKF